MDHSLQPLHSSTPCYVVLALGGKRVETLDCSEDELETLAERTFAELCCRLVDMVNRKGISSYLENQSLHLFLGTNDERVLRSFYDRVFKPVAEAIGGNGVDTLDDEQLHRAFGSLSITASQLNGAMDLFDYLLLTIMTYLRWSDLLQNGSMNGGFISLNNSLGMDFCKLGLPKPLHDFHNDRVGNTISPCNEHHTPNSSLAPSNFSSPQDAFSPPNSSPTPNSTHTPNSSPMLNSSLTNPHHLQNMPPISVFALTAVSHDKKGHDVIIRVGKQIQVYEMKVAGGDVYDVLAKFMDRKNGQLLDMGMNALKRLPDDIKSFLARLNDHLPSRPLDENSILDSLDFLTFLEGKPIKKQMDQIRNLLRKKDRQQEMELREKLAGSCLAKFLPSKKISDLILSFLDTVVMLNDLAAVEEFFHSGRVCMIDLTALEMPDKLIVDVKERRIPVFWQKTEIILNRDIPLLHEKDGRLAFGLETACPHPDNPFLLTEQELAKIIGSEHFRNEMNRILTAYRQRRVSRLMEIGKDREREIKLLSLLLQRNCQYYLCKREDGSIPLEDEFPQAGFNYLKQLILDRLKGGHFGIFSELQHQPFRITKGIIGTGDRFFFEAMDRLLKLKTLLTSSYDEVVITSRRGWKFKSSINTETVLHLFPLIPPKAKARVLYEGKRWIPTLSGIEITSQNGDKLDLKLLAELAEKQQIQKLIEKIMRLDCKLSEKNPHTYRQPSGLVEIPITNLWDPQNATTIHAIAVDLSRPLKDVRNIVTFHDYRNQWITPNQTGTKSRIYWKAALQTLLENQEINHYNEMVYLADQKSKIATFLTPILDLIDHESRKHVINTAKAHAKNVETLMKKTPNDKWPANVSYSGKDGQIKWNFKLQTNSEFSFEINKYNAFAWYLDAIAHKKTKDAQLSIINTSQNQKIIQALTLSNTIQSSFKINDIILGYNTADITKQIKLAIVKNQEGIITYFNKIEKNARTMNLIQLENAKIAIENYWLDKNGKFNLKNKPRNPINMLALAKHLPLLAIPPNLLRGTSGIEIPIKLKYYPKNKYTFIPITASKKDIAIFMKKYKISAKEYPILHKHIHHFLEKNIIHEFSNYINGIKMKINIPKTKKINEKLLILKNIAKLISSTTKIKQ